MWTTEYIYKKNWKTSIVIHDYNEPCYSKSESYDAKWVDSNSDTSKESRGIINRELDILEKFQELKTPIEGRVSTVDGTEALTNLEDWDIGVAWERGGGRERS